MKTETMVSVLLDQHLLCGWIYTKVSACVHQLSVLTLPLLWAIMQLDRTRTLCKSQCRHVLCPKKQNTHLLYTQHCTVVRMKAWHPLCRSSIPNCCHIHIAKDLYMHHYIRKQHHTQYSAVRCNNHWGKWLTWCLAKVLDCLTSILGSPQQHSVGASGGQKSQLVKCQALTTSLS